jgi:membrane peptidoglycan carboxypeptidase
MERRYSADPGEVFFTGGGNHVFRNFERSDNGKVLSVADGFRHSVNLVFIRLMRDIVHYYSAEAREENQALLADSGDGVRLDYLRRFADREGSEYLNRFFDDYRGLNPDGALALLASRIRPVPHRLAVAFRSVRPHADQAALREFLRSRLPRQSLDDDAVASLYAKYSPERLSLADAGYLAGVHPLELWLAAYLQTNPEASRADALKASAAPRQDAYAWLFKTHSRHKQDVRIGILREEDAFGRILDDWRRLGYPFGQLVPSYATAIGSSGDRPEALAEVMGIILNDGVRLPLARIQNMRFAADTPFETDLSFRPQAPERVLAPEVAATVRQALLGVVDHGTAQRAREAFRGADGQVIPLGGKTGTGDNRFERFASGGRLIESRVVDRTATFVFFIGDRFFGTITAYVPGAEAERYHFTSALAVQLLKDLAPVLEPLLGTAPRA